MAKELLKTSGKSFAAWRSTAEALSCGRTLDEQMESIRRYGSHGASPALRAGVLAAHGIAKPKAEAENCIIFGCYRPFTTPFLVRDSIRLLDMLHVDYTYLDQEYCCGAPLVMSGSDDQAVDVLAAGREFNQMNLDLARRKGAARLAYCCAGCVHSARDSFREASEDHVYILDLILDGLEQRRLRIPPVVVGYFEGCHSVFQRMYPGAALDWGRYRQRLAGIEGLKVVDLGEKMCCKQSALKIVERAEKMNLDKVVCACNWCYSSLLPAAQGRVQMVTFQELLVQSLEYSLLS